MTYKQFSGAVSVATNSYGSPTGYGVQAKLLIDRLVRHGFDVANLSNFGLDGRMDIIQTPHGPVAHYPRGYKQYSEDVMSLWHTDHVAKSGKRDALITLYDVWVLNELKHDGPILAWCPLDHVSMPPAVLRFLMRPNVHPVAMSPHGVRQLTQVGLEHSYVPHSFDAGVYYPAPVKDCAEFREMLGVAQDAYLVSIVAANKANSVLHRKGLAEQMMAFSAFKTEHKDAILYMHCEPSAQFGGFNLPALVRAVGLQPEDVIFLDTDLNRLGYSEDYLRAMYSASDVLLQCSYGEGFGVPVIEAQACGTRVITSGWSSTADLAGPDSWLVEGQPFWDELQQSFLQIPNISSIIGALRLAYDAPHGRCKSSVDFASGFEAEKVWAEYWLPVLENYFG
jgi:glycosyltransferase involved in cell wall biosynthesis